jgi:small-conductance mechanosensitive channel
VVEAEQQQLEGVGILSLGFFSLVTLTMLVVRRRVTAGVLARGAALEARSPLSYRPWIAPTLHVAVTTLIPLSLLLLFLLIQRFIEQEGLVFGFLVRLLALWTGMACVAGLARTVFLGPLVPAPHGAALFRVTRLLARYVTCGLVVLWGGEVLRLPRDVLALVRFLLVLTAAGSVFLLWPLKGTILALFPPLPNRLYQRFLVAFAHAYHLILFLIFTIGLLWGVGYHHLAVFLWERSWAGVSVFLAAVFLHHLSLRWVKQRILPGPVSTETALAFSRTLILTVTFVITVTAVLLALGLMGLLSWSLRALSTPLLTLGTTSISGLLLLQAVSIVVAFFLFSRLLRTYLDYRIYPALALDLGVAAAINTFFTYTLGALGLLLALRTMGLDLQALTIFAGALGIGAGFGLQSVTSNLAAGLTLVFGRTIRRGDVVIVDDDLGIIQEVGMRVTRLRTRDNIELLVPNAHLVDNTLTNYTHTSPLIRIHVPVGVSYSSDPDQVRDLMLDVARTCPGVESHPAPDVWFTEFAESSLNFELLVWMNARQTSREQVKSALYFNLFRAFKTTGIEIPFPQRDLHIRSATPWEELVQPKREEKITNVESQSKDGDSTPPSPQSATDTELPPHRVGGSRN